MGAATTIERAQALSKSAECKCGRIEIFPADAGLPSGWCVVDGDANCPDCAALAQPIEQPAVIPARAARIPARSAKAGHHGCRVQHDYVCAGAVVLNIRAGAKPVGSRALDRPIHFLVRRDDLTELIGHLTVVRDAIPSHPKGASND